MPVLKEIALVGLSAKGWQEAVEMAVKEAAKTIKYITRVDVLGWSGKVEDDEIAEYQANVKIAFIVKEELRSKK